MWYLLVDNTLKHDVVNGTTKTVPVAVYTLVGLYLFDTVLMIVGKLLYGNRFSTALLFHHLITLSVYSVIMYYNDKGQYLTMIAFTEEMIGPLSYSNWMFAKAKLTHLSIMKVNQQIIVYLYYFRTLLELYFFYTIIKNWSYVWNEMPVPLLITTCPTTLLVTIGLTPHWSKVEAKRLYRQYSRKISFYDMKPQEKNRTQ